VLVGYGVIGFVDDYRKVVRKDTKGLIARWKYFWMSVIALGVAFALYLAGKDTPATQLVVPFFKDVMPQLGLFYILLAYFVIVGTGNAVNLTDGLDGLAIMPTVFVAGGFALVAWATGNMNFASYLHIPYLRRIGVKPQEAQSCPDYRGTDNNQFPCVSQIRYMQVAGKVHIAGRPRHQRK
ncbi:hypothetical protein ACUOFC_23365, partial [Escherichia sp. TWPC-MK]